MSPVTHLLASWTLADVCGLRVRDQALVTWCGVLPDADGIGILIDGANRLLGRSGSWYYGVYHHALLHNVVAALAIPLVLSIFAANRLRVFALGIVAIHLHFLCDIVGSRGPGADDIWPLPYLSPFSELLTVRWSGQWPLNAWPNIAFTLVLLAYAFVRAVRGGYSPVRVVNAKADRLFVETVRNRWCSLKCKVFGKKA